MIITFSTIFDHDWLTACVFRYAMTHGIEFLRSSAPCPVLRDDRIRLLSSAKKMLWEIYRVHRDDRSTRGSTREKFEIAGSRTAGNESPVGMARLLIPSELRNPFPSNSLNCSFSSSTYSVPHFSPYHATNSLPDDKPPFQLANSNLRSPLLLEQPSEGVLLAIWGVPRECRVRRRREGLMDAQKKGKTEEKL